MIAVAMGWIGTVGRHQRLPPARRGRWHRDLVAVLRAQRVSPVFWAASASAVYGAWPSVVSNLLWSCIALHSGVVTLRERRSLRLATVVPLPVADHDPEPPTGPQPILLHAA